MTGGGPGAANTAAGRLPSTVPDTAAGRRRRHEPGRRKAATGKTPITNG